MAEPILRANQCFSGMWAQSTVILVPDSTLVLKADSNEKIDIGITKISQVSFESIR